MRLRDLEALNGHTLAAGQSLYRVQRRRAVRVTVRRGPFRLAPAGLLSGRFDLATLPAAYLAELPETALYESVFRREATSVSLAGLRQRELMAVQLQQELVLGDLRPHAASWPVLQSLRFGETQELAAEARIAGFDGLLYRSAQQFAQDCFVLFDPASDAVKALWRTPLVNEAGAVSRWVALAAQRSRVPLAP